MHEPTLFLTLTAALLLTTAVLYVPLQRSLVTEPLVATALGFAVGPLGFGWIAPERWLDGPSLVHVVTKYLLVVAVMAAALRLPHHFPKDAPRGTLVLVTAGMLAMVLTVATIVWLGFDLSWVLCLLIGGILAPTDPVLATTVVTGREALQNVPKRTRDLLTAESGANDGLAFPLVALPLSLLVPTGKPPVRTFLLETLLYQNALALLVAVAIGYGARRLLHRGFEHHSMSSKSFLSYTLALSLFTHGALELLHMNGLLGVFVSGLTFNYGIGDREEATSERVEEMMERLFIVPGFLLFGAVLPWSEILALGWAGPCAAALVLLLRRAPVYLLARRWVPEVTDRSDALFVSWFGPMGVAALYYASEARQLLAEPAVWSFPCLVVLASVLLHGVTCSPLVHWYGGQRARQTDQRSAARPR